jgi:AhpD family alkylhydroperoxidase
MTGLPFPKLDAQEQAEYQLFPINLTRMLLYTQGLTVPYWKYALGFRNAKISAQVREQVIVRVGALAECEYQLVQHKSEALRTGTSQELLAELIDPSQREFDDPALTALVSYVDSLVKNIGAEQGALDALRMHFPDNEVAEITLLAGTYVLCASFLKSLQVPLDDGPVDWAAADAYMKEEWSS